MTNSLEHEDRSDEYDANPGHDPKNHIGAHAGMRPSIVKPNEELLYVSFDHKATIDMGGTSCFLNKRVNWFHRWTIRLVFGWKVTNVE